MGPERAPILTAADVASLVGGRLVGDASTPVCSVAPMDRAGDGDLCFLEATRYAPLFARSRAAAALVSPPLAKVAGPPVRIIVDKPREALLALIPRLHVPITRRPGVHATARIGRGARIPPDATVDPYAVIGEGVRVGARAWVGAHTVIGDGVTIGDDVQLHPGVTLCSGTSLGDRVAIHSGARIGSDGFGYVYRDGSHRKIPHIGRCAIGDDVEIGANTTIDRGSIDDTVIGAGTKIDNLVHIAHNVRIGRLCLVMAQVGIAGSAHLEDGCIVAGQVGISGHNTIGAGSTLAGQAGVFGNVPAGETWSGYPARPHKQALRAEAALQRLPRLMRALERLATRDGASASPGSPDAETKHTERHRAQILDGDA